MLNVLLLSPGYPADMPEFTRGLAEVGAHLRPLAFPASA
jgi:hypothetical protein